MTKTRYTALSTIVLALVASACSSDGGNNTTVGTGGAGFGGFAGNPAGAPGTGGSPVPGNGGLTGNGGGVTGNGGSTTGNGGATQGTGGGVVGGAGAGNGGASSGGASGGGGAATGGAAGAGTGGGNVGGAAGANTGGAAGGGNPGIDLTGTWISEVKTSGKLAVPIVGMADADIDLVIRLSLTKSGGKLNGAFNICKLTTVTKPDPKQLTVTFTPAVIATMKTTTSENDFTAAVGQPVPVPDIRVLSGMDSAKKQVDADNDSHPGVTVPSNIGGALAINAYTGLDIKISLTSTLMDANTISGTTNFSTSGTVFGSDNILLQNGDITVTPSSNAVPFTAKKLAGDVACADVLKNFP